MGVSNSKGYLFWGPYNKDPTISGTLLGSPVFGNPHIGGCTVEKNARRCRRNASLLNCPPERQGTTEAGQKLPTNPKP